MAIGYWLCLRGNRLVVSALAANHGMVPLCTSLGSTDNKWTTYAKSKKSPKKLLTAKNCSQIRIHFCRVLGDSEYSFKVRKIVLKLPDSFPNSTN